MACVYMACVQINKLIRSWQRTGIQLVINIVEAKTICRGRDTRQARGHLASTVQDNSHTRTSDPCQHISTRRDADTRSASKASHQHISNTHTLHGLTPDDRNSQIHACKFATLWRLMKPRLQHIQYARDKQGRPTDLNKSRGGNTVDLNKCPLRMSLPHQEQ
jgi:hypothetical protein